MSPIETLLVVAVLLCMLWAAYALLSLLIVLRPFASRWAAARSLGYALGAAVVATLALGIAVQPEAGDAPRQPALPVAVAASGTAPDTPSETAAETALAADAPRAGGAIPAPCGTGGLALDDVVAVTGEYVLRAAPATDAPRIRNEKASEALGRAHYHQIDASTTVRRLCAQSDWTEVRIVTPDWLNTVTGWVPNAALREIGRGTDGARIYVAEDFYWDGDSAKYKPQIVAAVNRIARENRNCHEIDPSSVALSPTKSKPGDPVFFVTCGAGAGAFNVWFRPSDAEGASSFAAKESLGRAAAVEACEAAAKRAATHPSTVSFSRIWDLAYMPHVSGRARVVSSFTAKNGFGLELKYRIDCLFDGAQLIETQIAESRD